MRSGAVLGIALSGGKDSTVLLRTVQGIVGEIKNLRIVALTVDEGIRRYRPSSMEIAKKEARDLGLEHRISSFDGLFGGTLDSYVDQSELNPCTICGILRRRALNVMANEAECTHLLTGHNLDDMAQTVLMNVLSGDLERLLNLGPHRDPLPGHVPRAMPLRTTPETEVYLLAHLLGVRIHDMECPYSLTAKRGFYRDMLLKAEESTPGTRYALLRFLDQIKERTDRKSAPVGTCPSCGEPMVGSKNGSPCKACLLLRDLGVKG